MDLLTQEPAPPRLRRRALLGPVAAACALAVGACLWLQAPSGPHFSHEVHVVGAGLDCVLCHTGAYSGDRAGLPPAQLCTPCHGDTAPEPVDTENPMIPRFFDEQGRFRARPVATLSDEVRFSHRAHVREYGLSCEDCHGDTGRSDRIPRESAVGKRDCMGCHAERGKRETCSDCHLEIGRDWLPPSHRRDWQQAHGEAVRFGPETDANRCDLCHDRTASCQACHEQALPRDHTNFWRLRGHGFAVSMDRARCATCHRRDFCSRCHEQTEPLSHRAGFGDPTNSHCTSCHFPLSENGCVTCHKGTPSHLLAAPMPVWHLPSMNCRACHGMGVPLPHPDGGQLCTACHK